MRVKDTIHRRIPEAAHARSAHTHIFIFFTFFTVHSALPPKQANARNSFTDRFLRNLFFFLFFLRFVAFLFSSRSLLSVHFLCCHQRCMPFVACYTLSFGCYGRSWPRFSIMDVKSRHIAIQLCNVRVISSLFSSFFNDVVPFDVSRADAARTHEHRTKHCIFQWHASMVACDYVKNNVLFNFYVNTRTIASRG